MSTPTQQPILSGPAFTSNVDNSSPQLSFYDNVKHKQCYKAKCWVWALLLTIVIAVIVLYFTVFKKKKKSGFFQRSDPKFSITMPLMYDNNKPILKERVGVNGVKFNTLGAKSDLIIYNGATARVLIYDKHNNIAFADWKLGNFRNSNIWEYNPDTGSLCPQASNGKAVMAGPNNTIVMSKWNNTDLELKWDYNTDTGVFTNRKYGSCLETGGNATPDGKLGHFKDDGHVNKRWSLIVTGESGR